MRICFIPIDNRPVCYTLAKDIAAIDNAVEFLIPPREYLGSLTETADIENLFAWLNNQKNCDAAIISLDTLAYGGLIPSRRGKETFEEIKLRIENLKHLLENMNARIYAFSSIMRISNNNYNEEEKEYWSEYGKKIFEYSYNLHKYGQADSASIPESILKDYLETRKRNFEINKMYLEWQKEGFFDTLIFSKDDCSEYGLNIKESFELESLGGLTKTGADEIPLTLLARAINKNIKVYVEYTVPDCKNLISNYEDVSVEKSVSGQLVLGGFESVNDVNCADMILIVNNFREKQGEHVMNWDTPQFDKKFIPPNKPYAVADIRYANGADNAFVEKLLPNIDDKFLGYAGWNTTANTLGSLLAGVKVRFNSENLNESAFKKLQIVRFLDDWAYQANVRKKIKKTCSIKNFMKPYELRLAEIFDHCVNFSLIRYIYPWNRKFEIEIILP